MHTHRQVLHQSQWQCPALAFALRTTRTLALIHPLEHMLVKQIGDRSLSFLKKASEMHLATGSEE
jgi:hypothetical protein